MATIIVLFNLADGVTVADYETWARTKDLPTVRGLGSVARFDVLRASGMLGTDTPSPYQYVEIIEVPDMAAFGTDIATETMQATAARFQGFADAPQFILTESIESEG